MENLNQRTIDDNELIEIEKLLTMNCSSENLDNKTNWEELETTPEDLLKQIEDTSDTTVLSSPDSVNSLTSNEVISEKIDKSKIVENQNTPQSFKRVIKHRKSSDDTIQQSSRIERITPLPILSYEGNNEVWQNMVYKEEATLKLRSSKVFSDRTSYLPRMRAILLDWIMEVCEVYHLRRTTYYLAVDYIDRYLTINPMVPKTQLQLLGVTCLFIAAKLEEIYPPKLAELSYVCDGACTEQEILSCETLLLNALGWDLNQMTPTTWLNLYLQIHYNANNICKEQIHLYMRYDIQFPQYSAFDFVRASHLIDLFSMDPGFLRFSYGVIAACAMYYIFGKDVAVSTSGFSWEQLDSCVEYMRVFNKLIKESSDPRLQGIYGGQEFDDRHRAVFRAMRKHVPNIIRDESHCMQTHVIDLDCFESATLLRLEEMGIRVEKTFAKRKKKIEKSPSPSPLTPPTPPTQPILPSPQTSDDNENEKYEEETTIVIYELERILDEAIEHVGDILHDDKEVDQFLNESIGSVNILTIEKKTKLSFDDILSSIHNDYYENKYSKC